MGWWSTEHGLMGDAPADCLAETLAPLDPNTPANELAATIAHVITTRANALCSNPEQIAWWAIEAQRAGRALDFTTATPGAPLVALVERAANAASSAYLMELERRPTPPELVHAFTFHLGVEPFELELQSVLRETAIRDRDPMVRRQLALDPRTPLRMVEALAQDAMDIVTAAARRRLDDERALAEARDPGTRPPRLVALARHVSPDVALAALDHPAADAAVCTVLSQRPEQALRIASARNARTPSSILGELAKDTDIEVRVAVASHPQLPVDALRALASSYNNRVKLGVAHHVQASPEMLAELARGHDSSVKHVVARRLQTPPATLLALADDWDDEVSDAAFANPNYPPGDLVRRMTDAGADWLIKKRIALAAATPSDALATLARDRDYRVRAALASRPNLAAALAELLGSERDTRVRVAVARNSTCPADVLEILALDANDDVRRAATATLSASLR